MELFLDLVHVFAVTQLSHLLVHELSRRGAFHVALFLLATRQALVARPWIPSWLIGLGALVLLIPVAPSPSRSPFPFSLR
ncbi:low temperature requirement protein A [Streptomyces pseudogriseolus]|uniref:low temperature requirement protein A n=1 Tax=Streptomyces pseudogriseolus TaxID=36817 RepID=UPI003FA1DD31